MANHKLPAVVISGDGDSYGEGLNHLLHAARGNEDITAIIHDNQIYGLTTGQTSPTSKEGYSSKSTPHGVIEHPINPLGLTIIQGATFVARGFAGDIPHLTELFKQAIAHKGFSHVDVLQPCVTFNHTNTYEWFHDHIYKLDNTNHHPEDKQTALAKTLETDKIPIGLFYKERRPTYQESLKQLKENPLVEQAATEPPDISKSLKEFM